MYTVTVYIAGPGIPLRNDGTGKPGYSTVGHMWYEISDGSGETGLSYGFAPDENHHGQSFAPGQRYKDDSYNYLDHDYSKTIEITQEQYDALKAFGENPSGSDFNMDYDGLDNSCIDFTWKALSEGGLNPIGYEGFYWPTWNAPEVDLIVDATVAANLYKDLIILAINSSGDHFIEVADELSKVYDRQVELNAGQNPNMPGSLLDFLSLALESLATNLLDFLFTPAYGADINPLTAGQFTSAKTWTWPRDPIILDLNGNGLETVGLSANIHFDFDADGVLTKTGWAGKDDALLVWDRNANGAIDTGAELFGDFTPLANGTLAPNGFAALAALDANHDGLLDASDPAFAQLKLWRDADQNGTTDTGELISLQDAGIVSLNLANTLKNQRLANGNTLSREGSFTRLDGTSGGMGEYRLAPPIPSTPGSPSPSKSPKPSSSYPP